MFHFVIYALFLVSLTLRNQTFCDSANMISKSDIICALVQYQHDIIFALLLFCSETSDKNNCLIFNQFLMRKIRFSKFQNNEYDDMISVT